MWLYTITPVLSSFNPTLALLRDLNTFAISKRMLWTGVSVRAANFRLLTHPLWQPHVWIASFFFLSFFSVLCAEHSGIILTSPETLLYICRQLIYVL